MGCSVSLNESQDKMEICDGERGRHNELFVKHYNLILGMRGLMIIQWVWMVYVVALDELITGT